MRFLVTAFTCVSLASGVGAQTPSTAQIDAIVDAALTKFRVPGVAVAIVYGDRVVYL